jgi:hypothetical protein
LKSTRVDTETTFRRIALAPFLSSCPLVLTLGIRPCLDLYSERERELLLRADRIFFPTRRFVDIFRASRISTFPSPSAYRYQDSRVLQQLLFDYLDCPRPLSRVYFGSKQKQKILDHFKLPVEIRTLRNAPNSVHIARHAYELEQIVKMQHSVLITECIEWSERIQLICVMYKVVGALQRCADNCSHADPEPIPLEGSFLRQPLDITERIVRAAQLDDILVEWGHARGQWQLLGMARPPVKWRLPQGTSNRHQLICELIQSGVL